MLIHYLCEKCKTTEKKYYRKAKDILSEIKCECGDSLERQLGAPASNCTQIIDNGLQARKVEVPRHIVDQEREKLYKED